MKRFTEIIEEQTIFDKTGKRAYKVLLSGKLFGLENDIVDPIHFKKHGTTRLVYCDSISLGNSYIKMKFSSKQNPDWDMKLSFFTVNAEKTVRLEGSDVPKSVILLEHYNKEEDSIMKRAFKFTSGKLNWHFQISIQDVSKVYNTRGRDDPFFV